jgi:hypothetical protein
MSPIRRIVSKQLGSLLLEKGILKKEQLDEAMKIQKEKGGLLGTILVPKPSQFSMVFHICRLAVMK